MPAFSDVSEEVSKEQLKEENEACKKQLAELGAEMDRMLLRRDKKGKEKPKAQRENAHSLEYRQAFAKNEALRKERIKLSAEIVHSDTARRISETKNAIGAVDLQIIQLREEIRSLENVKKGQEGIVDLAKHAEEELRFLNDEHRQELNLFRDRWRNLQETVKHDEKNLFALQTRYHNADEKNKLGIDRASFDALSEKVDAQDARIEELKAQVDELAAKSEGGRKKVDRKVVRNNLEKQRLNKRIDQLREVLRERDRELKLSYAVHKTEKVPQSA